MLSQDEFEELIADTSKRIEGNITWLDDENHFPTVEFRSEVVSDAGYPIYIKGSYNRLAQKLSYVIIHRAAGRIYGLDLGQDHRNPDGERVGEKHKHRWDQVYRDKKAYVPPDITAPIAEPVTVWHQFCLESKITHNGIMQEPPPLQLDVLL